MRNFYFYVFVTSSPFSISFMKFVQYRKWSDWCRDSTRDL